jgi:hypothetical protein
LASHQSPITAFGVTPRISCWSIHAVSQRKRKRVEEIFGWMKTYGGLRKTFARGIARVQLQAYLVGCNRLQDNCAQ